MQKSQYVAKQFHVYFKHVRFLSPSQIVSRTFAFVRVPCEVPSVMVPVGRLDTSGCSCTILGISGAFLSILSGFFIFAMLLNLLDDSETGHRLNLGHLLKGL